MTSGIELKNVFRRLQALAGLSGALNPSFGKPSFSVVFFPAFDDNERMADHLNRANWYLPGRNKIRVRVIYQSSTEFRSAQESPVHSPPFPPELSKRVRVLTPSELVNAAQRADLVLVWRRSSLEAAKSMSKNSTAKVINVDPLDPESLEYGVQAGFRWRFLFNAAERRDVLDKSRERLRSAISAIPEDKRQFALVLGTGRSFNRYTEMDRGGGVVIACNSAVHNQTFLESFRPDFIVFGDAAHHLGPSHQAAQFRDDVEKALELLPNLVLVTNAKYFGLLEARWRKWAERIVWIEQSSKTPVFNLVEEFSLPMLDSVMNVLLLPLASTVSRNVLILGADGFSAKEEDNDDFWGHAESFDYSARIKYSHLAHPTFEEHRQKGVSGRPPTAVRHNQSIHETITSGEEEGVTYLPLMPSSIPALAERALPLEFQENFENDNVISLLNLVRFLPRPAST